MPTGRPRTVPGAHRRRPRPETASEANSSWLPGLTRMVAFGLVGVAGVGANTLAMDGLLRLAGLNYLLAAALATQVSTTFNFLGADFWAFRGSMSHTRLGRYWRFSLMNNVVMVARLPFLAVLVQHGMGKLAANAATLLLVFGVRFLAADRVIYRAGQTIEVPRTVQRSGPVLVITAPPGDPIAAARSRHAYQIHDILSVVSDVAIPELECFRAAGGDRRAPDVDIRIGQVGHLRARTRLNRSADGRSIRWEEHLGRFGANFNIDFGAGVTVTASPALAASPHVLYTNVIEALLRFLLVDRGYLLLHSACLQLGQRGIMLSARTDTGKTGTILRLLRDQGGCFLSDDMTIIDANGMALSYRKPLTISRHTLQALEAGNLSRAEWRRLRVQSLIYSREGRGLAMRLAQHNLPILTINGIMQRVVPPPKYDVQRLVPCALADRVQVEELFIIERGPAATAPVDPAWALAELLENTEDAYGFPPYQYLAPAIAWQGGTSADLRARERAILASALRRIRVQRHRSADFGWAQSIASYLAGTGRMSPGPRGPNGSLAVPGQSAYEADRAVTAHGMGDGAGGLTEMGGFESSAPGKAVTLTLEMSKEIMQTHLDQELPKLPFLTPGRLQRALGGTYLTLVVAADLRYCSAISSDAARGDGEMPRGIRRRAW